MNIFFKIIQNFWNYVQKLKSNLNSKFPETFLHMNNSNSDPE